ncbi:hypothetical protein [Aquabacterium sp. CECT 9606]|uniref:hypothetical protein n=1 Tax=Aquabacterium sp. CECT 9606 TaxID=2845822 RepID=UPI0010F627EA|nr:hypothetical protein [Aquabacterium sp. CECT 9606]CAH0349854.1 hypothetical protein AQB9606_01281 [Aquabacterium sp. CECT 9606]
MSGIEIYVRHRSDGAMLNFHLSSRDRQALIHALTTGGGMEDTSIPIHLELSLLPQWLTDPENMHARIPISAINISVSD